jgi:hypothetical protein
MGRGPKTSDINSYLEHQKCRARPPPTCQIQGETIDKEHLDYLYLLAYFAMDPSLHDKVINMLDNPVEGDLQLVTDFKPPEFIINLLFYTTTSNSNGYCGITEDVKD